MSKLRKLAGFCLALAGISLVTNQVAFADAKYTRKLNDVKVQQTERTKKLEVKKAENIAQPEINADQFLEIENEVQNIRDELITEYKGAIDDTEDDDPRKPELMFRLAEAYSQKQRYFHSIAMETANKIDHEANAAKKTDLANKKKKLTNEENKWLAAAVKSYLALAANDKFKNYARMDEVLFFLAYTLQQAGRKPDAFKVYQRLTKDYPQSKFIPDAYLAIADQFFTDNNLDEAEKFYDKVLKFPKAPVYAYALYKKGWVYYNQSRAKDSYAAWSKVKQTSPQSHLRRGL